MTPRDLHEEDGDLTHEKNTPHFQFGERATHRLGKTVLHTYSDLFKPGQNFSHLFTRKPVHTHSQLFTPVHNCSHLFTPVHTSVTILDLICTFFSEHSAFELVAKTASPKALPT